MHCYVAMPILPSNSMANLGETLRFLLRPLIRAAIRKELYNCRRHSQRLAPFPLGHCVFRFSIDPAIGPARDSMSSCE
jgi:hypothetical protein